MRKPIKYIMVILFATTNLLYGCSTHYAPLKYESIAGKNYCKSKIIKVESIKDIRVNVEPSRYGSVKGYNGHVFKEIYSENPVSEDIGHMIEVALGTRGCYTEATAEYILLPMLSRLYGVGDIDSKMVFEMPYLLKEKGGNVLYEGKIAKNITEKASNKGRIMHADKLAKFINKNVSSGIDEIVDDMKMWEKIGDRSNVRGNYNERVKERLLFLEELRSNNMISEKDYNIKKAEILESL